MTARDRAASLIVVKEDSEQWIVTLSGCPSGSPDDVARFVLARLPSESMADMTAGMVIRIIAREISAASSDAWIESGVCSVYKKLLTEHPPGPSCFPKTQREYPG